MSKPILPPEILGEIFRSIVVEVFFAALKAQFTPHAPITGLAIHLSSVSTYWRSVALSTHAMWSYIEIRHSIPWVSRSPLLALALARSQHVPLHIIITMQHNLSGFPEVLSAWDALAEQLMAKVVFLEVFSMIHTNYTIQLTAENTLSRCLLFKQSPVLKTLNYSLLSMPMTGGRTLVTVTDWTEVRGKILPHAPLLVELSLAHFGGLELSMLRPETIRGLQRFSHLALNVRMRVADVFTAAPGLRHLSLGPSELPGESSAGSNLCRYGDLVSLSVEASTLAQLNRTSAPNLVRVKFEDEHMKQFDVVYLACFLNSTPYLALEHLILPTSFDWEGRECPENMVAVIPLFAFMPNIRSLSLPTSCMKGSCIAEWTRPENVRFLPKLRAITLRRMIPFGHDAQLFEEFFQSRQAAMAEICDSANRLPLTIEMDYWRDTAAAEDICELLGRYVKSIRVVGSP